MGVRTLAAALLLLVAVAGSSIPEARAEAASSRVASAVRDTVRALTLRLAYGAADSLAAAALESPARDDTPDSLLASIAEWRLEALRRGGWAGRPSTWDAADQAIRLKERAFGAAHPEVARTLTIASTIHMLAGNGEQAEAMARRCVSIYERAAGADSLPLARALQILGNAVALRAGYAEARALHERSIAVRERLQGPEHADVANGLNALGTLLRRMGEYEEAKRVHERAIRIRERSLPPDDPDLAWSLNNYANVLFDLGEVAATKPIHERVLAMRLRSLGPHHPDVAFTYNNLANTLHALGDYVGARRMLEASLAIREASMGPEHADVAQSLNNLAYLLQDAGDYEEARRLYERSLAIRERVHGPRHPDVTTTLDRLSNVLADLGELDAAKRGFERSLAINRAAFGEDHTETAETMSALAGVEAARGDSARAEALYERALAIEARGKGARHPEVLLAARHLAEIRSARGRAAEACSLLQTVLSNLDASGLGATPEAAACHASLGVALARSGRFEESLAAALRAEQIGQDHLRLTARSVEERLALRYAATRPGGRDLGITLLDAGRTDLEWPARVWDAVIRGRAAIMDELAARHRSIALAEDPATQGVVDSLARIRERLARLVLGGTRGMPSERYAALVQDLSRAKERVERELAERSAAFRADEVTRIAGIQEVTASMPKGSVLVAYVRYNRTSLASMDRDGEPRYGAFVAREGAQRVRFIPLGAAVDIEAAAMAWREGVSRRPSPARRAADESRCRVLGGRLRALVWDPLLAAIENPSLVLLVPDGVLHRIPFGTLPAAGGREYLVQRSPPIHVLPAEHDLLGPGGADRTGRGLLALGGPDFDATSGPGRAPRPPRSTGLDRGASAASLPADCVESVLALRFAPLPEARDEVRGIARLWRQVVGAERGTREEKGTAPWPTVVLLSGREATEAAMKRMAPGRRVVHLATHGFFLHPPCSARRPSSRASEPDPRSIGSPLLRSGLALAGSNGRPRPRSAPEDGLLTAEEIAGIDLRGVEWAVLSACDTGGGDEHVSEGLLGLRRAFQSAGARTVIVSLWRVDDAWARRWMSSLYRARFEEGLDTAHAVRRATIEAIEALKEQTGSAHPYAWGAFVAAGDWH